MHAWTLSVLCAVAAAQLVFVKPDFAKYTAASGRTREVFALYDPGFEAGSLDEAYLDVTDYCKTHAVTGQQVKERHSTADVDKRRWRCGRLDNIGKRRYHCCQ